MPKKLRTQHKFLVRIPGVGSAEFQEAKGLEVEVAVIEHYEGGNPVPTKVPGRVKISNVTLLRGKTNDRALWNWMKQVVNLASGAGLVDPAFRREVVVEQLDYDNSVLDRWLLHEAWSCKYKGGEWDSKTDGVVVESAELAYHYPNPET